jgi:hypothetical protein
MAVVHVGTSGEVCAVLIANVSISAHYDVTLSILNGSYKSFFTFTCTSDIGIQKIMAARPGNAMLGALDQVLMPIAC